MHAILGRFPSIQVILLAISTVPAVSALWSNYDNCALDTLKYEVPQDCAASNPVSDSIANLQCICASTIYIQNVARALKCYCPCFVLETTAKQFVQDCNNASSPSPFDQQTIVAIGFNNTGCQTPACTPTIVATTGSQSSISTPRQGHGTPTNPATLEGPSTSSTSPVTSVTPKPPGADSNTDFQGWKIAIIVALPTLALTAFGIFLAWRKDRGRSRGP